MDRNPATGEPLPPPDEGIDDCEEVTVSIPIGDVDLPGFVLDMFFDVQDGGGGDRIQFTVVMAHPSYAATEPAGGS